MDRTACSKWMILGALLATAAACSLESSVRLAGVAPVGDAVIVTPTIVGRVYTGYGPEGRFSRAQVWIGQSPQTKAIARGTECAARERETRTDNVGEFLLAVRTAPAASLSDVSTARRQSICVGDGMGWGLRLFDVPDRSWSAADTLYLHCMVHTGILDCLPVAKKDFAGHRPDAG